MFDKMLDFNGMFGKVSPGMCRLSFNGQVAVKTSNGYKTYNVDKGRLVNCSQFCLGLSDEMFFVIPTTKVKVGDIILVNKTPRCVVSTDGKTIKVVNYENNTVETILPERHVFMGNVYFYGKITSPFCKMFGAGTGMKSMLKMAMMSKMFGNGSLFGGSGNGGNDMMGTLLMMNMLGGKDGNFFGEMMDGMFDDDSNPLAAVADLVKDEDTEDDEELPLPTVAEKK